MSLADLGKMRLYYTAYAFLLIVQLCPIWFTTYPPLHDYPNHLARTQILHQYAENESYRAVYELDWRPLPNLAMDRIVPPLLNVFDIETASKVFLSLMVVLFNVGIHVLGATVHARPHWSALAASFFTYNYAFAYGFVNYIFGLGMFLITLALWLRMRPNWTVGRLLLVSFFALLCYFSHLSSFVFLAVGIACVTVLDLTQTRRFLPPQFLGLVPLVPPLVMYLIYSVGLQHRGRMEWGPPPLIMKKLAGFILYPFLTHDPWIDLVLSAVFCGVILVLLVSRVGRLASKELLLAASVFVFLYLIFPTSAALTSYVDRRFIIPAVIMFVLAIHIDASKTIGRYMIIALLTLSVGRVATVWKVWAGASTAIESQVHALDLLPDGAKVYSMLMYEPGWNSWFRTAPFYFVSHYATIYRHAFVPTIYAQNGVHPVRLRRSFQTNDIQPHRGPRLDEENWDNDYAWIEQGTPLERVKWSALFSKYDYVWGYGLSEDFTRYLLSRGQLVARTGEAVLVRVKAG
ncbi:MAG: hypothetical protein NTNFB02_10240 [Nitrospira sp.]